MTRESPFKVEEFILKRLLFPGTPDTGGLCGVGRQLRKDDEIISLGTARADFCYPVGLWEIPNTDHPVFLAMVMQYCTITTNPWGGEECLFMGQDRDRWIEVTCDVSVSRSSMPPTDRAVARLSNALVNTYHLKTGFYSVHDFALNMMRSLSYTYFETAIRDNWTIIDGWPDPAPWWGGVEGYGLLPNGEMMRYEWALVEWLIHNGVDLYGYVQEYETDDDSWMGGVQEEDLTWVQTHKITQQFFPDVVSSDTILDNGMAFILRAIHDSRPQNWNGEIMMWTNLVESVCAYPREERREALERNYLIAKEKGVWVI